MSPAYFAPEYWRSSCSCRRRKRGSAVELTHPHSLSTHEQLGYGEVDSARVVRVLLLLQRSSPLTQTLFF